MDKIKYRCPGFPLAFIIINYFLKTRRCCQAGYLSNKKTRLWLGLTNNAQIIDHCQVVSALKRFDLTPVPPFLWRYIILLLEYT
jgi:hypothetical protein